MGATTANKEQVLDRNNRKAVKMKKMYFAKSAIYAGLTAWFFTEIFWPLSNFPTWVHVVAFVGSLSLYLVNLYEWWRETHEIRTRS